MKGRVLVEIGEGVERTSAEFVSDLPDDYFAWSASALVVLLLLDASHDALEEHQREAGAQL